MEGEREVVIAVRMKPCDRFSDLGQKSVNPHRRFRGEPMAYDPLNHPAVEPSGMKRTRWSFLILAVALGPCASTAEAQGGVQFKDWRPEVLASDGPQGESKSRIACAALVSMTGFDYSITAATPIAATADAPEFCRVSGLIQPEIRFELSLPAAWNGRFYMFGNGGFAGERLDTPGRSGTTRRALARGFAVAQTNTGHDAAVEPLASFAASPQKLIDFAYRSQHVTTLAAKTLVQAYYGAGPRRSYYDGCSTGGRQGLILAQRFPEDFDGILAHAPVLDHGDVLVSFARTQRALRTAPIPNTKLPTLAAAASGKCDAVDGLVDGLVADPRACDFVPARDVPRCAAGIDNAGCFTDAQLSALETIFSPTTVGSTRIFPPWLPGGEVFSRGASGALVSGWTGWVTPLDSGQPPSGFLFGDTFFKYIAFGRPMPDYDWMTFDLQADYDKLQDARTLIDATDTDLSRFRARGGKLLGTFGWADPALNPLMGVEYYEGVQRRFGAETANFFRLFMAPGMFHCGGGPGPNTYDAMTPLVEWVERGIAPEAIIATKSEGGEVKRTRPLCPYPAVAQYKGSGSIDDAASFSCVRK